MSNELAGGRPAILDCTMAALIPPRHFQRPRVAPDDRCRYGSLLEVGSVSVGEQ